MLWFIQRICFVQHITELAKIYVFVFGKNLFIEKFGTEQSILHQINKQLELILVSNSFKIMAEMNDRFF